MSILFRALTVSFSVLAASGLLSACTGDVSQASSSVDVTASVSSANVSSEHSASVVMSSTNTTSSIATNSSSSMVTLPVASTLVYAINAGGPSAQLNGITYEADGFRSGGMRTQTNQEIVGVNEDAVFQNELYGDAKYEIPVTNASYSVKLHFTEIYYTETGARTVNVNIEGQPVIENLDIFDTVGMFTAYDVIIPEIMVADGLLTIDLSSTIAQGTLSGFAIYSDDGGQFISPPIPEVGAAVPSPGCRSQRTLNNGRRTIQSSGATREYILDIPNNYDSSHPYRLIFGIHAFYGHMDRIADGSEINGGVPNYAHHGIKQYSGDTTIFVSPNGTGSPNGWPNQNGQQTIFFDDMLKELKEDLCIDESRVFAHGFSYGSGMSYNLACSRPDIFRAVGIYGTGDAVISCGNPAKPVAYLGAHGITDGTFNISSNGHKYRDRMVSINGCTPMNPPEPNQGSLTHTCTSYECPNTEHPVRWCAFDGGHIPAPTDGSTNNHWNTWLAKEGWEFFSQF